MKLSTAIRRGAKMVKGQHQGDFFQPFDLDRDNFPEKACALGAAALYLSGGRRGTAVIQNLPADVYYAVTAMNDDQKLTFNQIAYRLERDPNLENPEVS